MGINKLNFFENGIISVGDVLVMMVKRDSSRKVEKLFSIRPSYL